MLHVLLLILKIIGIALAVLLGILLLALLLVLFVPVRYQAQACRRGGQDFRVKGKVSWLLHILMIPVAFQDGKLSVKIRIFGWTVKNMMETEEELSKGAENFFQDTEEDLSDIEEDIVEGKQPETVKAESQAAVEIVCKDTVREEPPCLDEKEEGFHEDTPDSFEKSPNFFQRLRDKLQAFLRILLGISKKIRNLKYTFGRFCVKIKRVIRKAQKTKAFLTDERTKSAVRRVWEEAKVLLKHILPRRVRGEVHFGTGDPASTGEILGGISIFYPIFIDNVKVLPDFEQRCLEGELFVKGRVQLVVVLWVILRLLMDKNVRYVYRKLV